MAPRPYTTSQGILVTAVSVAGTLAALFLLLRVGFSWPLFLVSILAGLASLYGLYRTWRAPFTYRVALRFVANLSLFTALLSVLWAVRS